MPETLSLTLENAPTRTPIATADGSVALFFTTPTSNGPHRGSLILSQPATSSTGGDGWGVSSTKVLDSRCRRSDATANSSRSQAS